MGLIASADPALPVALIPAFKPSPVVVNLAEELLQSGQFSAVILVDDGSGREYEAVFRAAERAGAVVLKHFVNLGKGMALRTGFNHILCCCPQSIGVVTLDADGQHLAPDVLAVAERLVQAPSGLVLGCRSFGAGTPLRSRVGNLLTRRIMHLLAGFYVSDTQTGLRGIPRAFLPLLLQLKTCGYDYELDMLINSRKQHIPLIEVPIKTVYIENNRSSHFNPFLDSLKIYLVFIKFNISSLITAFVDYLIFFICTLSGCSLALSMVSGRAASWVVNYTINKKFVFNSCSGTLPSLRLYMIFEVGLAIIAYLGILIVHQNFDINIYASKIFVESLLYLINFTMQRDFVFERSVANVHDSDIEYQKFK